MLAVERVYTRLSRLTRQEMERAALDLGAKFRTVQQWRYRGVPARWQLKLIKHFGAMIILDDVASQALPPVRQSLLLIFAARDSSRLRGFHEGQLLMISFYASW